MIAEASQPSAKIFTSRCDPELRAFIDVFHGWIRHKRLDALLIDVADYSHVHRGPGVMVVAHEAYWAMDETGGRVGMFYKRRHGEPEPILPALDAALRHALTGAKLVEKDAPGVSFATDEVVVGFEDRLLAPNDEATFDRFFPKLEALAQRLFGPEASVTQLGDHRAPFRARLGGAADVGLDELLSRIG